MTRMLASVVNAAEADVVLRLGADVIDLKDPGRGALGAVPLETARETIRAVAKRRETSATLGDPPYHEEALLARARALAAMGVDYLKLAVDGPTLERLRDSLKLSAREIALVGILFADEEPDFALLPDLAALGFKGAMLDTRDKSRGRLLDASRCRAARGLLLAVPRGWADERACGLARGPRRSPAHCWCAPTSSDSAERFVAPTIAKARSTRRRSRSSAI